MYLQPHIFQYNLLLMSFSRDPFLWVMKVRPGERKRKDESWRGRRASAHCGGKKKMHPHWFCCRAGRQIRPLTLDWSRDWRGLGQQDVKWAAHRGRDGLKKSSKFKSQRRRRVCLEGNDCVNWSQVPVVGWRELFSTSRDCCYARCKPDICGMKTGIGHLRSCGK